jgi:hypothetical protein
VLRNRELANLFCTDSDVGLGMGLGEKLFKCNIVMHDSRPGPTFGVALAEAMGEPRGKDEKGIESVRVEPCCEIVRQKRLPTPLIDTFDYPDVFGTYQNRSQGVTETPFKNRDFICARISLCRAV